MGNETSSASSSTSSTTQHILIDSLPKSAKKNARDTSTLTSNFKIKNISIDPKFTSSDVTKKSSVNSFYTLLQEWFDASDRASRSIKNNVINLTMGNNQTTPTIYNCGGNIKLNCVIPSSDDNYPNYTNIILNTKDASDQSISLMNILTSFITDPNFLSVYFFNENLSKNENGVPIIDISKNLDYPNLCWNWNAGRNYTIDTVKNIANYYILKLNDLIDYVITNDLCVVDSEFSKKLLSLFANSEGYIYNHSNGTLVLPSLVNWLASKNDGKFHALSMCGYVKQGSKIFPVRKGSSWDEEIKWNNKNDVTTNMYINVPRNINKLILSSSYNYPFVLVDQFPQTIETPKTSLNCISNVNIQFKEDKYSYDAHVEKAKSLKYATQEVGTKTSGVEKTKEIIDEIITIPSWSFKYEDVFASKREYVNNTRKSYDNGCPRVKCGKWAWCDSKFPECRYKLGGDYYKFYQGKNSKLNDTIISELKKPNVIITYSKNSLTAAQSKSDNSAVVIKKFEIVSFDDVGNKKYALNTDVSGNTLNLHKNASCQRDNDSGCCKVCSDTISAGRSIANVMGVSTFKSTDKFNISNIKIKVSYTLKLTGCVDYNGSLSSDYGASSTDESPIYNDKAICLYKTNMDLYSFNENVFSYWVAIIKNTNNQQLILNEIRKYINEHPALILVNKINNSIGKYARSFSSSVFFMGNPLGPPLITIPNSYAVQYKNYFPSFKVINNIDSDKITYNKSLECNDIINSISCEKSNNYLDVLFSSIITESRMIDSEFDVDNIISIILPSKGYQLFEVIDKSIVTLVPNEYITSLSKYSDTNSILYNFDVSKIVLSFKDFSSDNQSKTLSSAYKKITSVHVPIINFSRKGENINVMVNTLTNDNENLVHIYVSSDSTQEMICNLKGAGQDEKDKNIDKNSINNIMLNVQYNGIDSNVTPMCLQLHFM